MANHRIYDMKFNTVYPHYVTKVTKKGQSEEDLLDLISWLTGYTKEAILSDEIQTRIFRDFFEQAPLLNPNRTLITGRVCGVKIEEVEEDLMRNIRYMDKIVEELSKGKAMDKIKRKKVEK